VIPEFAFRKSGLMAIAIPESVFVLKRGSFAECNELQEATYEGSSRLDRILDNAFIWSSQVRMSVPPSVMVIKGSALIGIPQWALSISQGALFRIGEGGIPGIAR
jgi:hypothetical protein